MKRVSSCALETRIKPRFAILAGGRHLPWASRAMPVYLTTPFKAGRLLSTREVKGGILIDDIRPGKLASFVGQGTVACFVRGTVKVSRTFALFRIPVK